MLDWIKLLYFIRYLYNTTTYGIAIIKFDTGEVIQCNAGFKFITNNANLKTLFKSIVDDDTDRFKKMLKTLKNKNVVHDEEFNFIFDGNKTILNFEAFAIGNYVISIFKKIN